MRKAQESTGLLPSDVQAVSGAASGRRFTAQVQLAQVNSPRHRTSYGRLRASSDAASHAPCDPLSP